MGKPKIIKEMKNPKKKLRAEADKIWYNIIIQRNPICESCGEEKSTQAHHYYYKGSFGHLRYNLDNGIGLGLKCHFLLHHHDPKPIEEEIVKQRGKKWFNKLVKLSKQRPSSFQTTKWYEDNIQRLNKYLND